MALERKRPEDKSERWQPRKSVRCYLDDIDDILAVLCEIGDVEADTPDYHGTIKNAEELTELGAKRLDELTLVACRGSNELEVNLGSRAGYYLSSRDDLALVGAAHRVRRVLEDRELKWDPDYSEPRFVARGALAATLAVTSAGLLVGEQLFATGEAFSAETTLWLLAAVPFVAAAFLLLRVRFGTNPQPSGTTILAYRADAPTWWERHRTEVAIGLFTNAIVGVVFFVLGLWVGSS